MLNLKEDEMKLTKARIESLPTPSKGQQFYWDKELAGFGVRVSNTGGKSYVVRGSVNGHDKRITIASCKLLSCDEARKRAMSTKLEMLDGVNPQEKKQRTVAQSVTLTEIVEDYLKNKRTKHGDLRPKTKQDIERCVRTTFEDWADKPVVNITKDMCVKRFRERSKTAPTQANQSFRYLRALLNWAREKYASSDGTYPILPVNPVAQAIKSGGQANWNLEKPRTTRIPRDKIGLVWSMLQEFATSPIHRASTQTSADLVAFMLLTGVRVSEARELTWDSVDLKSTPPIFSLTQTKNHNVVTLPISKTLLTVLDRRYEKRVAGNNYVFPAARGNKKYLSDARALLERLSETARCHIHPHALRRTFEDIAQLCNIDYDQRRQLLNHLANDVHGMAYANNPDPAALLPAVEKIGEWVESESTINETLN